MDNLLGNVNLGRMADVALVWAAEFLPRVLAAVMVLVLGVLAARWVSRGVLRIADRAGQIDPTLRPVIAATLRYGILIVVIVAVLGQIGIETTSVLAALGAAGLAIGLAMQGTLANIAAGFMLLWLRPIRVGEYIETAGVAGIVREVNLFATQLDTFDGLYRFVPNSELWNKPLTNYSRNVRRMMDLRIGIAYGADIDKARRIMLELAHGDERVLREPDGPLVFVDSLGDSAVVLAFRAWIRTDAFWPTQRFLIEETKQRLDAAGIEIPFPQRVMHVITGPASPQPDAHQAA